MPNDSKHIQASLSPISTDWLRLQVVLSPRFQDLAIFVVMTDRQTDYFTPAHARGVIKLQIKPCLPYTMKHYRAQPLVRLQTIQQSAVCCANLALARSYL